MEIQIRRNFFTTESGDSLICYIGNDIVVSNKNAKRVKLDLKLYKNNQYNGDIKIVNEKYFYYSRDFLDIKAGGIQVFYHYLSEEVNILGTISHSKEIPDGWWQKVVHKRYYDISFKEGINSWINKFHSVDYYSEGLV